MKHRIVCFLLTLCLCISACIVPSTAETNADDVVIYYTNDAHAYIDGDIRYSHVAALKASTPNALLLDAGDHIQGAAYGSMDRGESIIKLMNAAGYDAATFGNHEFDYGMARSLQIVDWANYPYLSCNFFHEDNSVIGETVLSPYEIFEVGGKKIAVIGITTPESFTSSTPAYFQNENGDYIYAIAGGKDGQALYSAVQAAIDATSKNADYIIVLGHLGDDPSSAPWRSEDVIAHTAGLDAWIDGHSHSTVPMRTVHDKAGRDVVLTQTGEYLHAVGKMTISGDQISSTLLNAEDLATLSANAQVQAIEDNWIAEIEDRLGQVIGTFKITLDNYDADGNRLVRSQETNSGDFAADALYYLFDDMGLDVNAAIMNGGGVRNEQLSGEISYLSCKEMHTFGNVACLQSVSGQQILDALEWGAREAGNDECGGFLQVSGLKYEIDTSIPSSMQKTDKDVWCGSPVGAYRVHDVKIYNRENDSWDELDLHAYYNLAGYNYTLRNLGDGYAMFDGSENVLDYVMEDYMVLANYVQAFKDGVVDASNSPLLVKYPGLSIDYGNQNGSDRITFTPVA